MNAPQDTRSRLLDVAQDLIQRRGLNAMSFQDLSDAVGIRKASVHHHFANKAEMLSALLDRFQDDFARAVAEILQSRANGRTKLKRYCGLFQATLEAGQQDNYCLCGMLAAEAASLDDNALTNVRRFARSNGNHLRQILADGIDDGSLSARCGAAGAAEMVLATLEGGLLLARVDGGPKRFATTIARLVDFLSNE